MVKGFAFPGLILWLQRYPSGKIKIKIKKYKYQSEIGNSENNKIKSND